jgi:hypothetical protein
VLLQVPLPLQVPAECCALDVASSVHVAAAHDVPEP